MVVEKPGFRSLHESELELEADQTARLNLRMAVGAVTESVEVTAAAPILTPTQRPRAK